MVAIAAAAKAARGAKERLENETAVTKRHTDEANVEPMLSVAMSGVQLRKSSCLAVLRFSQEAKGEPASRAAVR